MSIFNSDLFYNKKLKKARGFVKIAHLNLTTEHSLKSFIDIKKEPLFMRGSLLGNN